ncbi:ribonuclease H-like [Diabrotica undecimpunctata]|uniref:ribonuclease H-like n=1 Tax=Diabrotica undecimpunctata TaxID=50387 RepID=UPI003B635C37
MRHNCIEIRVLFNYVLAPFIFKSSLLSYGVMAVTGCSKIDQLIKRLDVAETRSKLLNSEVRSIRKEIAALRSTLSGPNSFAVFPKTGTGVTLSDEVSSVDGCSSTKKIKASFTEEDGYTIVFTDGACENNGKPNAKAGIGVWFRDDHPLNISQPVKGKATNNTAEIQACIQALNVLETQGVQKVKIFTDSQFTISCMTKWITNWKRNNWKTASGGPVKNKEDLQKLDTIIGTFSEVKWVHVAGHRGIKGNEEADKLAREGSLRYQST